MSAHMHSTTTCRHDAEGPSIWWLCGHEPHFTPITGGHTMSTTKCRHCGMTVRYEPPDDVFLGGWVGDDGWGIVCGSNDSGDGHEHEPAACTPAHEV